MPRATLAIKNIPVQTRFLLGPAGSGKTFRCLAEIRRELIALPDGPPLLLLAPKQATAQLERQLLADPQLQGYTRLQILSFERLAEFVLEKLQLHAPESLAEEGRVMVLRALILRHEKELKMFRRSARRPGFATQLSQLLRELQQHRFTPDKLRAFAAKSDLPADLQTKLHDLALLAQAHADWLQSNNLHDDNRLLDTATAALCSSPRPSPLAPRQLFAGLWLDGFAEMTPQEMDLLAAVMPGCGHATLAFCLDASSVEAENAPSSWLSIWGAVGKTYRQCRDRITALPGCEVVVEPIKRDPDQSRFASSPELAHLESSWAQPSTLDSRPSSLSLHACSNPEAEATLAAREILHFVRDGARFRDIAVLVRRLDEYHKPIERTFRRYGIPVFLDRRKSVSHHPLAELTRSALRTVAFDWQHEDWFAALKCGFAPASEDVIDRLENEALARGWRGAAWREPLPVGDKAHEQVFEQLRVQLIAPFAQLATTLAAQNQTPTGAQLAAALRQLWIALDVETRLEAWGNHPDQSAIGNRQSAIHNAVLQQMESWLENLARAFPHESLPLRDWLPILEAGLSNLSVGVIPPALDQVLVGAIDRSRNPDLKLTLLLGFNEGVFPVAPATRTLLTESDRIELAGNGANIGLNLREQLARERYYGYIACTRASERLIVSYSTQDEKGRVKNPSPFVAHLKRLFPALTEELFSTDPSPEDAEHISELVPALLRKELAADGLPQTVQAILDKWARWESLPGPETLALSPAAAAALFGKEIPTSVSALESFAACPFQFFAGYGLGADERQLFETDSRQTGSFQHEILAEFHRELKQEGKLWRDITPLQARERVALIGEKLSPAFGGGLFAADGKARFLADTLVARLQDVLGVLVDWMRQYEFDPADVELAFGLPESPLPAWKIELKDGRTLALRGKIDRVDLFKHADGSAQAVVLDYKSSGKQLDATLLHHGLQLQLLSYLGVLRRVAELEKHFGVKEISPAGVFFIPLRGKPSSGSRVDVLETTTADSAAFQHSGRFDLAALVQLDNRGEKKGTQFKYKFNKDESLAKTGNDALPSEDFTALLDKIESDLRRHGESIFAGEAAARPFRKGKLIACTYCEFKTVCRFDSWVNPFNVLTKPKAKE